MLKSISTIIQGDYTWIKKQKAPNGNEKTDSKPKKKTVKKRKTRGGGFAVLYGPPAPFDDD